MFGKFNLEYPISLESEIWLIKCLNISSTPNENILCLVCATDRPVFVVKAIINVSVPSDVIIRLYYIFIAIVMLFLVIFVDDKSGNFLRGDKSFRTL